MSRRDHDRLRRRRRKIWRIVITVIYALLGALAGIVFLLLISRR